jgi:hypothetical protein
MSGSDGFGKGGGGISFIEQRLPLEVAGFDIVAVDDAERADSGTCQ